ncbi:hypothetical protein BVRB_029110, partial [Beta vulgaris subsp. vulgaris]
RGRVYVAVLSFGTDPGSRPAPRPGPVRQRYLHGHGAGPGPDGSEIDHSGGRDRGRSATGLYHLSDPDRTAPSASDRLESRRYSTSQ